MIINYYCIMKTKLLVSSILFTTLLGGVTHAQLPYSSQSSYEMAAMDLRSAPARQYNFSKAVMSDVMRLMAEDAGISFFGLPDEGPGTDRMVTFTINASPFTALETLAKANGVSLIHENGIWYLRPANDQELIGRIYEINYNAQELVRKNNQGGVSGGSNGGSNNTGAAGAGINLQGQPDFFVTEPSRLLEDIRGILDIPTTGSYATIAPTASVDTVGQLSLRGLPQQPGIAAQSINNSGGADDVAQAKVIWNSDSNTLYVVATRQQHQWIEAYLASADREQTMIAVEVKFLESSRDPNSDFGIDWTGVLGRNNGLGMSLTGNTGDIPLNNIGSYSLPTAVLSYNDLNARLSAMYSDSRTRSVSYPRMVTLDNREVSFRSVVNQPVLSSSASASLGAGATTTSSVEYLPIGTVINVLPKTMNNGKILLNVSVTVSDIVGTEVINGNPFPIASSRVYSAPLTVQSGYTVAISGLDAANVNHTEQGLPVLGKLPLFGGAFRFRHKEKSRQHLMMLITPVIMNNGCGIGKTPMTKEPWCRCGDPACKPKSPCSKCCAPKCKPSAYAVPAKSTVTEYNSKSSSSSRKSNFRFGRKKAKVSESAYASATPQFDTTRVPPVNDASVVATPVSVSASSSQNTPSRVAAPNTPTVAKSNGKDITKINASVSKLRSDLDSLAKQEKTPENRKKINSVVEESKTLLSQIEQMRGDDTATMSGELGDTWWKVIKLKTDAVKMSRE